MKTKLTKRFAAIALAMATLTVSAGSVRAAQVFSQGFETDTDGWLDENSGWSGTATRVPSGTNGIVSHEGAFHAEFTETDAAGGATGPFTRFDGYRDTWTGGFTASADIYLDTAWAAGEGFEYSVAVNGSDGNHQRDFLFHVSKDTSTGSLLVAGDNNATFGVREDLETLNHYEVTASGWYTFEQDFYDAGDGTLAVDLNLRDSLGSLLFTETRNAPADVIATEIGGNRYGWFTDISVAGGIAVDGVSLSVVPEPTSFALAGLGLCGLATLRRRRRA